jgi:hypothetical protein
MEVFFSEGSGGAGRVNLAGTGRQQEGRGAFAGEDVTVKVVPHEEAGGRDTEEWGGAKIRSGALEGILERGHFVPIVTIR